MLHEVNRGKGAALRTGFGCAAGDVIIVQDADQVFKREILQDIELEENCCGFEPEFTAKIAGNGYVIYEVGVSYYGRTYEQGKKIGWKDGVRAILVILKYGLFRRPRPRTSSVSRPARVEASR